VSLAGLGPSCCDSWADGPRINGHIPLQVDHAMGVGNDHEV
jgi:hypothetical protein